MRLVICTALLWGVFGTCWATEMDLEIGDSPQPPVDISTTTANETSLNSEQQLLFPSEITLVSGANLTNKLSQASTPSLTGNGVDSRQYVSDLLSIMSPEGGVLTLWALNVGNWVWGYTLFDSKEFGAARIWRIFTKANGTAIIQNAKESTCLSAYKNGVIHSYCDMDDPKQLWVFHLFDNQAVQIQNVATKQCLQTPSNQATRFFSIFLTNCIKGNTPNSDQQWFITAPPIKAGIIFSTNSK